MSRFFKKHEWIWQGIALTVICGAPGFLVAQLHAMNIQWTGSLLYGIAASGATLALVAGILVISAQLKAARKVANPDNIRTLIRDWIDQTGSSSKVREVADNIFTFDVQLFSKRNITIQQTKSNPRVISIAVNLIPSASVDGAALSKVPRKELNEAIRSMFLNIVLLDTAVRGLELPFTKISVIKELQIDGLNWGSFIAAINRIDGAVGFVALTIKALTAPAPSLPSSASLPDSVDASSGDIQRTDDRRSE